MGALGTAAPRVPLLKGHKKRKGKKEREGKRERRRERERKRRRKIKEGGIKREKIDRKVVNMRGAPFSASRRSREENFSDAKLTRGLRGRFFNFALGFQN